MDGTKTPAEDVQYIKGYVPAVRVISWRTGKAFQFAAIRDERNMAKGIG